MPMQAGAADSQESAVGPRAEPPRRGEARFAAADALPAAGNHAPPDSDSSAADVGEDETALASAAIDKARMAWYQ